MRSCVGCTPSSGGSGCSVIRSTAPRPAILRLATTRLIRSSVIGPPLLACATREETARGAESCYREASRPPRRPALSSIPAHREHRPVLGVFLKLTSVVLLSSMAACVKYLGSAIPSGETIFVRGVISVVVLALIAWRVEGLGLLKTSNLRSHALRSLCGTASMFCWFFALTLIPLAEFWAIAFTSPLFLTLLAMLFLGERIHRYRWTALAIGFVGVLVIVGPHLSLGAGSLGVGMALAAAVFSAFAVMFLRSMSGSGGEHPITITFYFSVITVVCSVFTVAAGWPMPTPRSEEHT